MPPVLQDTKTGFYNNLENPGYTIEAGYGINPLPISQFNEIYKDNLGILVLGSFIANLKN